MQKNHAKRTALALFLLFAVTVSAQAAKIAEVIPIGHTVGIKMQAEGVLIVQLTEVQGADGTHSPAKEAGVQEGDVLCRAGETALHSNDDLQKQVLFREKLVAEPFLNPVRAIGTMHDYDVFANVVVLTPPQEASRIYEQTKAYIDRQEDIAVGISHLPNDCGLIFKVLGKETSPVKKVVRQFCSTVRMQVKGKPLPEEFAWR